MGIFADILKAMEADSNITISYIPESANVTPRVNSTCPERGTLVVSRSYDVENAASNRGEFVEWFKGLEVGEIFEYIAMVDSVWEQSEPTGSYIGDNDIVIWAYGIELDGYAGSFNMMYMVNENGEGFIGISTFVSEGEHYNWTFSVSGSRLPAGVYDFG